MTQTSCVFISLRCCLLAASLSRFRGFGCRGKVAWLDTAGELDQEKVHVGGA